jgi:hypothetical protein
MKKWVIVKENRICDYCLGLTLSFACWWAASRHGWNPCEVARCTGHHHTLLHVSSDCSGAPALTQQVVGARWLAFGWRKSMVEKFRFRPRKGKRFINLIFFFDFSLHYYSSHAYVNHNATLLQYYYNMTQLLTSTVRVRFDLVSNSSLPSSGLQPKPCSSSTSGRYAC